MTRFSASSERNYQPIQIVGGPHTKGILLHPSDQTDPGVEFATPRVTLRVRPTSLIRTGMVINTASGRFIVAAYNQNADYRNHTLFQADRRVVWTRTMTATDPVTKQPVKVGQPTELGDLWVLWQRQRREYMDLPIRANQETSMTVTGAPVEIGDFLNSKRVTRVSFALGVRVLELQA